MELKVPGDFMYFSATCSFVASVRSPRCVLAAGRFFFLQVFKSLKSKDLQTCHGLSYYELIYISAKPEPHLTQIQ